MMKICYVTFSELQNLESFLWPSPDDTQIKDREKMGKRKLNTCLRKRKKQPKLKSTQLIKRGFEKLAFLKL